MPNNLLPGPLPWYETPSGVAYLQTVANDNPTLTSAQILAQVKDSRAHEFQHDFLK